MADDFSVSFYTPQTNGERLEKRLRRSQVSVQRLARMFKIIPESLYITEDYSGPSEFPDDSGAFPVLNESTYKVEGEISEPSQQNHPTSSVQDSNEPSPSTTTSQAFGAFRSFNLPGGSKGKKRKQSSNEYLLKVFLARMDGKKVGETTRLKHFMINEENANVQDLTVLVREGFENNTLVLVQSSGCRFEDSDYTRAFSYWKVNSRKVFAVPRDELERRNPGNRDNNMPRNDSNNLQQHQELMVAINGIQSTVQQAISTRRLIDPLKQALNCLICQNLSTHVILGLCCRQVLGCRDCIAQYRVNDNQCLHCRADNFNTIELTMLDQVLQILRENNL